MAIFAFHCHIFCLYLSRKFKLMKRNVLMDSKEILLEEIDQLPPEFLEEVRDFIKFLKQRKENEKLDISIASESSLKKDWLLPEEEEAWKDL